VSAAQSAMAIIFFIWKKYTGNEMEIVSYLRENPFRPPPRVEGDTFPQEGFHNIGFSIRYLSQRLTRPPLVDPPLEDAIRLYFMYLFPFSLILCTINL
jgi:hypothetical protein